MNTKSKINDTLETNYVYMIQRYDFVESDNNIYKIGRSRKEDKKNPLLTKRLKSYLKGSKTIKCAIVNNCKIVENEIKQQFIMKFTQCRNIGTEYFRGELNEMEKEFDEIVNRTKFLNEEDTITVFNSIKKEYKCEKCGKPFKDNYYYIRHINRKTSCIQEEKELEKIKNKICEYCNKMFAKPSIMKNHMTKCKMKPSEMELLKNTILDLNKKLEEQAADIKEIKKICKC